MKTLNRRHVLTSMSLLPLLAACGSPSRRSIYKPLSFRDRPQIQIDAAAIEMEIARADSGMDGRAVEYRIPMTPQMAVERWAKDRLVAAGTGKFVVVIRDASIVETRLPKGSFASNFGRAVDTQLDAKIDVRFNYRAKGAGLPGETIISATGDVTVSRSQTFETSLDLNERDEAYMAFVYDLAQAFDKEAEKRLQDALRDALR